MLPLLLILAVAGCVGYTAGTQKTKIITKTVEVPVEVLVEVPVEDTNQISTLRTENQKLKSNIKFKNICLVAMLAIAVAYAATLI